MSRFHCVRAFCGAYSREGNKEIRQIVQGEREIRIDRKSGRKGEESEIKKMPG